MTALNPVSPTSYSRGFSIKQVTITGIDSKGYATCDDGTGTLHGIPIYAMRAKGELPQVGELWFITKELGQWTFACVRNFLPKQGIATMATSATSAAVVLNAVELDNNYGVLLTPSYNTTFWFSSVTTTGFTIRVGTAPGSASPIVWKLVR